MNAHYQLNIGIVGAGSFSAFAAKAFLNLEGVHITAISDINESAGLQLAKNLNSEFYPDYHELLNSDKIDLVYIATPPFLHYSISKKALLSGKHVICEKPAALKTVEAEELQLLAKSKGLLYVVNLMQRYNPLYNAVSSLIRENILGSFLHGFFENYASDEYLDTDHWFWNESKSGGIFIEHGVHFFDMFSGWLGEGNVINAVEILRPDSKIQVFDRVQAIVSYRKGIVNFYHGFDQPKILDRQEMRLQFEKGDITLYEWVPVKIKLHALIKTEDRVRLSEIFGQFEDKQKITNRNFTAKGRAKEIQYDEMITVEFGAISDKEARYQQMLSDMLSDQWKWIRNKDHIRVIDDNNAIESLRMAERSREIAIKL